MPSQWWSTCLHHRYCLLNVVPDSCPMTWLTTLCWTPKSTSSRTSICLCKFRGTTDFPRWRRTRLWTPERIHMFDSQFGSRPWSLHNHLSRHWRSKCTRYRRAWLKSLNWLDLCDRSEWTWTPLIRWQSQRFGKKTRGSRRDTFRGLQVRVFGSTFTPCIHKLIRHTVKSMLESSGLLMIHLQTIESSYTPCSFVGNVRIFGSYVAVNSPPQLKTLVVSGSILVFGVSSSSTCCAVRSLQSISNLDPYTRLYAKIVATFDLM